MIIDTALFRNGMVEEIVTLESITHHEDYIAVKENLYCAFPSCNCKLIYIPKGIKVAYFKKWKGYNHIEDCPFYKETEKGAKSFRVTEKTVSRLNNKHVNKVLKETFDKFNETEEEKEKRIQKQKQKARNRKNKVVERQGAIEFEDIVVNLPTTSLDANEVREGEKNPTVRKRMSILDFVLTDIGLTRSTVGFLMEIKIDKNYAVLTITDDYDRLSFSLFLEEAFFANSSFSINTMLESLKELHDNGEHFIVTCVGEVVLREGQLGMLIMDENKLIFNRLYLSELLLSKNTLF